MENISATQSLLAAGHLYFCPWPVPVDDTKQVGVGGSCKRSHGQLEMIRDTSLVAFIRSLSPPASYRCPINVFSPNCQYEYLSLIAQRTFPSLQLSSKARSKDTKWGGRVTNWGAVSPKIQISLQSLTLIHTLTSITVIGSRGLPAELWYHRYPG